MVSLLFTRMLPLFLLIECTVAVFLFLDWQSIWTRRRGRGRGTVSRWISGACTLRLHCCNNCFFVVSLRTGGGVLDFNITPKLPWQLIFFCVILDSRLVSGQRRRIAKRQGDDTSRSYHWGGPIWTPTGELFVSLSLFHCSVSFAVSLVYCYVNFKI